MNSSLCKKFQAPVSSMQQYTSTSEIPVATAIVVYPCMYIVAITCIL